MPSRSRIQVEGRGRYSKHEPESEYFTKGEELRELRGSLQFCLFPWD